MCWEDELPEPGACKPALPDFGGCCIDDHECGPGQSCVDVGTGLPVGGFGDQAYAGVCVPAADPGTCWSYDDCGAGEDCVGVDLMWCWDLSAETYPTPGVCEAVGGPEGACCEVEAECAPGLTCMDPGLVDLPNGLIAWSGTCVAPAPEGSCYGEADCPDDAYCAGGALPWCWEGEPQLGTCVEGTPGLCCGADADCDAGDVCADGTCLPAPPEGGCWTNGQCDCGWEDCPVVPTTHCVGATWCPCDVLCGQVMMAGTCEPVGGAVGACCTFAEDCAPGLQCVDPWVAGDPDGAGDMAWAGTCAPVAEMGECWTDDECHPGEVCDGAQIALCWEDAAGASHPGACHAAP